MNQVMDILNSGKDADRERGQLVSVDVLVDQAASRSVVMAVRDAFLPEHATSEVRAMMLDEASHPSAAGVDLAVIVAGGSDCVVKSAAERYARAGVPVAVVAESVLDAVTPALPQPYAGRVGVVVSADRETLLDELAKWVVQATPKSTAFAANFSFCRRAKVQQLVQAYASQNAAVGAVGNSGGSDVTVMTANQAKLALDIAAAYGRPLTIERAQELVGVISAGMGYRAAARAVASAVPGMGWALKAGVGYLGTMATANAIAAHFERLDAGAKALPRVRALAGAVAGALPAAGRAIAKGVGVVGAISREIPALGEGSSEDDRS